jgi:Protein of unknown function (DUF1778)
MNQQTQDVRVVARIPPTVKETLIVLSERDAQTVFDLLEHPPTPNQRLLVAVDRHRAFIRANNAPL